MSTAATSPRPRDARIDAAKAVAIVLVVLGHAKGIPPAFALLVYSFHVPLFFFLSGWVLQAHGSARGVGQAWPKLARSLLLPYAGFFLLAYAYWLVTRHIGEKAARWGELPWWDPLIGLATAIGPRLYVHPALWFLPALFVTTLLDLQLRRWLRPGWRAALGLAVAWVWIVCFPPLGLRLPFALDVLPVAWAFFALGALGAAGAGLPRSLPINLVLGVALALPWAWLAWSNGRVDVNQLQFGASAWKFFLAALLGTGMTLCLARLVEGWAAVQWIGRNTLLILCTHILIFFVLSGVAALAGLYPPGSKPGPGWALAVSAFALAASVPLRWLLARWAPWAIGLPRHAAGRAR